MARRTKGEGSIYQRKDKRWTVQYYVDGERKTKTFGTQAKARAKLLEIKNALAQGIYSDTGNQTLRQWLEEWLENYAKDSIKLSTYISYETYIRAHIKPAIGDIKMKELSVSALQKFLVGLKKSGRVDNRQGGLSAKTIRNIHQMLHAALKQAVDSNLINQNYADGAKSPKVIDREMRVLDRNEQKSLIEACRASQNPASFGIIFTLFTGLRIGELLGLRWINVDFDKHNFTVKETMNRLKTFDEGSAIATTLERRTPKTVNSKRTVDLIDELYSDLLEHKNEQDAITAEFPGYNPEGYVFVSAAGKPFDPRTYQDLFKRELKAAGVADANFHCLRHTFATRAIENGMDILVLSRILGHAKPSTTLNMYGHVLTEHRKESMDKISSLYDAPSGSEQSAEQEDQEDTGPVLQL